MSDPEFDTTFDFPKPRVRKDVLQEFSRAEVDRAVEFIFDFVDEWRFNDVLSASDRGEKIGLLRRVAREMSTDSASDWNELVDVVAREGQDAPDEDIIAIARVAIYAGFDDPITARPSGPYWIDKQMRSVEVTLDGTRLKMKMVMTARARLLKRGKPVNFEFDKVDLTLWAARSGADWIVDGWWGRWSGGKIVPDRT